MTDHDDDKDKEGDVSEEALGEVLDDEEEEDAGLDLPEEEEKSWE